LVVDLPLIAREAITAFLSGESFKPSASEAELKVLAKRWDHAAGVFVTLWYLGQKGRELRGCIGRHSREHHSIIAEVADLAVAAATEDPRFEPVQLSELKNIKVEVSILGSLEKIKSENQLDPHRFGVLVESGRKHATLLPNIEGIDSVEEQLRIVRQKAGMGPSETIVMYRYPVEKIEEAGDL
jgi:AmmeMemoRadiSam system protein A